MADLDRPVKKPAPKKARQRYRMLDMQSLAHFKYDLNEVIERSTMDPVRHDQFIANLIQKGLRMNIDVAQDYIDEMVKKNLLDEPSADRMRRLLVRYSRFR